MNYLQIGITRNKFPTKSNKITNNPIIMITDRPISDFKILEAEILMHLTLLKYDIKLLNGLKSI